MSVRAYQKGLKLWLMAVIISLSPSYAFSTKYAGEFLNNLGVGARALGMGGAFVAVANDVTAGYWNPAGLIQLSGEELIFMHAETFGNLVDQDYIAYAVPYRNSSIAFSLIRLGGEGIKLTELADPNQPLSSDNRAFVKSVAGHSDYGLFFSYARSLSSRFFLGGNLKIIYRNMPEVSGYGLGLDVAALTFLGHSLAIGINLQDASSTFLSYSNGTVETISPTLKLGIQYKKQIQDFSTIWAWDNVLNFEGRQSSSQLWTGDFSTDVHLGFEAWYKKSLAFRLGLDRGEFAAGIGTKVKKYDVDVAYLSQKEFEDTYRISLKVSF